MRRTGRHAVQASFNPLDDRTRDVLTRGIPISSPAVFENGDTVAPISLLLESCSRDHYDGLVRLELAVDPHETCRLPRGVDFELLAGEGILGRGFIHSEVNIFESLAHVTSRREPFHTQYLSDALTTSLNRDRSLFDNVWLLMAPNHWSVPEVGSVETEKPLQGGRRIDILIRDSTNDRAVGVEIKIVDGSAQEQQLVQYWRDLQCEDRPQSTALAYLTPFKDEASTGHAPKAVNAFRAFKEWLRAEYGGFANTRAKHVSWLDIAAIPWDGNELWDSTENTSTSTSPVQRH